MFDGILTVAEEGWLILGAALISLAVLLAQVLAYRKALRLLLNMLRR